MPHGDIDIPEDIVTKAAFYANLLLTLESLLDDDQTNWITALSNASSLLYHSFLSFPLFFGVTETQTPVVNWSGFYLVSSLFPASSSGKAPKANILLLGPFNGRPACQQIRTVAGKGVCADAFVNSETVLVKDVESYPGHIACDGDTKSEIVIPLVVPSKIEGEPSRTVGVLDLDSVVLGTFDEEDRKGLEAIAELIVRSCEW
ncbi:GAF domain-like protein [Mrakia frigida]|uniref:L-methionine (R)-S-oxide reductase n=1 Tax=Mrakia frigida TaxID=29902 RepID=UPI003FCC1A76